MQKTTSEFLGTLSLDDGSEGLFVAAEQARVLANGELDRALAGALQVLRLALLTIAHELESDPSPELWDERRQQVTALAILARNRDPASFAALANFA